MTGYRGSVRSSEAAEDEDRSEGNRKINKMNECRGACGTIVATYELYILSTIILVICHLPQFHWQDVSYTTSQGVKWKAHYSTWVMPYEASTGVKYSTSYSGWFDAQSGKKPRQVVSAVWACMVLAAVANLVFAALFLAAHALGDRGQMAKSTVLHFCTTIPTLLQLVATVAAVGIWTKLMPDEAFTVFCLTGSGCQTVPETDIHSVYGPALYLMAVKVASDALLLIMGFATGGIQHVALKRDGINKQDDYNESQEEYEEEDQHRRRRETMQQPRQQQQYDRQQRHSQQQGRRQTRRSGARDVEESEGAVVDGTPKKEKKGWGPVRPSTVRGGQHGEQGETEDANVV